MLSKRSEIDTLDGWTQTVALIAHTERIQIGSMRLVEHWNAARLAQAVASIERIAPGRLRFQISVGDWETDARFGYPRLPVGERIAWLDETLTATRALWRGETVTLEGRYVRLDRARVRPTAPAGRIPVAIAARRPRMLEMVAAHADLWDVNLPAIPEAVDEAAAQLEDACRRCGRDPAGVGRSMWLFARLTHSDPAGDEPPLAQFRRLNPWFRSFSDSDVEPALITGDASECWQQLTRVSRRLRLDLPVLDLSGLPAEASRRTLEALAPNNFVDADT
jgi:alkanesulfonate monooxygenase SsuD/methylene tetrahydromethanopterin reductase-like flavin-dependent oxidoreductase (luciferase family)